MAEQYYTDQGETGVSIKTYHDYRDVLAAPDIDAVVITVPDHSHARLAIEAAIARKHIYVQKPVTYSIAEAIGLRRAVEATKVILQTGSQQRSERPWRSFRAASEAVRNGRIGQLQTIRIGVGLDKPSGKVPAGYHAGAAEFRLRTLAGFRAGATLHGGPSASAGERERPSGLDHDRRFWSGHDHELGRASC